MSRTLLLITCCLSNLYAARAIAQSPLGDVQVYKTVDQRDLKLWVLKPEDWAPEDTRPAVVFFHGGGWVGGNPNQFETQGRYLASRGLVVIHVEYRLLKKSEKAPPVDCVRDAKSAMRWVRSHARELGIDAQRIAAGGGSAGGHLAAFVGMVEGQDDPADDLTVSPKANALLLFNPVFDNGPQDGWGTERVGERYPEFSPAHNISADDPPALVMLGTKDSLIPVSVLERFEANMKAAAVRCDSRYYQDQPHGFFNKDPFKTQTLIEVDRFLKSLGWLQGEPTLSQPPAE